MDGVEDVEEVLARRALACGIGVGEVAGELGVLLQLGPERLHRQLVVVGDGDVLDVGLLHQLLLPAEDVLEEVLADDALVREVVLHYSRGESILMRALTVFVEVHDEVLLALQLGGEVSGVQVLDRALLGGDALWVYHLLKVWILITNI